MNEVTLDDKIQLIYEFNNRSPLFAKAASLQIETKDFESAIDILENGLESYPDYPTALITYSLALANLGRHAEAIEQLKLACDIIDSPATEEFYLKKLESISSSLLNVPEPHKKGLIDGSFDLEELAKKIERAKIPKIDNTKEIDNSIIETTAGSKIISETMADILYKQGNLIEALDMYEQVLRQNPQKKITLEMKINAINKKLSE